ARGDTRCFLGKTDPAQGSIRRIPYALVSPGYHDEPTIRADLAAAGFREVDIERITRPAEGSVGAGGGGNDRARLTGPHGNRSGRCLSPR
ncbi:MAG TPA: hypothetical protein VLR92_06960, partial [Blastocatellia bacterium]|nr:hypothetical protein [Blastocatellia bacterium]